MTDQHSTAPQGAKLPAWFWLAAAGALLFECIGCYFYLAEVRLTPEEIAMLPLDQAQMLNARPAWYYAAFGVAVWVGLAGSVGLLLRKAWAETLLLVSLLAVVAQFSAILIVPEMRIVSSDALLGPVIVILLAYGIWQLSRLARKGGWLR